MIPAVVVKIPANKLQDGYVLVGGGCDVSYASNQSPNSELLFESRPVENGWQCSATDPAIFYQPGEQFYPPPSPDEKRIDDGRRIWNPAKITATVILAKVISDRSSFQLVSIVKKLSSEVSGNPEEEVALDGDSGYVLSSGGCATTPAKGTELPELIVVSEPNPDGDGWHCKGIDPSSWPNNSRIDAYVVGTKLKESGFTWFRHAAHLQSEITVAARPRTISDFNRSS